MKGEKAKNFRPKALISLFLVVFLCVSVCSACSEKEGGYRYLGSFLSADVVLYLYEPIDGKLFKTVKSECESVINRYESLFSTECEISDVYRFNLSGQGEKTRIDESTYRLITIAKDLYLESGGAFDPTIYPLVDLWGFSARFDQAYVPEKPFDRERNADGSLPLPDEKYVSAFSSLADLTSVLAEDEGGSYYLEKTMASVTVDGSSFTQKMDLSALAKGYLCDALSSIVSDHGIKDYYISLGSSSLYLGERAGKAWTVELVDPKDGSRAAFATVGIKNANVSTSGTYENAYFINGKRYHHIVNGKTGAPFETDLLSAVVIGESGVLSDGISTTLVALGSEKALEFVNDHNELDFVLVAENGKVYSTVELTAKNENYELIAI